MSSQRDSVARCADAIADATLVDAADGTADLIPTLTLTLTLNLTLTLTLILRLC